MDCTSPLKELHAAPLRGLQRLYAVSLRRLQELTTALLRVLYTVPPGLLHSTSLRELPTAPLKELCTDPPRALHASLPRLLCAAPQRELHAAPFVTHLQSPWKWSGTKLLAKQEEWKTIFGGIVCTPHQNTCRVQLSFIIKSFGEERGRGCFVEIPPSRLLEVAR